MRYLIPAILLLAACNGAEKGKAVSGKYCPECAKFCGPDCPTDEAGKCKACGNTAMEMKGVERNWYHCSEHKTWHDKPCGDDSSKKCCSQKTSVMPGCEGSGSKMKHCPGCRAIWKPADGDACKGCGATGVDVEACEQTLVKCAEHKTWHEKPCAENAAKSCCSEVKAWLICLPK
jgi:hypothetical protein